jgi:hypothetical protein
MNQMPKMPDPSLTLFDIAEGKVRRPAPKAPSALDRLTDVLSSGGSVANLRRELAKRKPEPRPMADVSQVWIPWPECWPLPEPEEIAKDAARRAAFYSRGKRGK